MVQHLKKYDSPTLGYFWTIINVQDMSLEIFKDLNQVMAKYNSTYEEIKFRYEEIYFSI